MHAYRVHTLRVVPFTQPVSRHADGAVMPSAEVLAVPSMVPAAGLATPASLRADSGVVTELVALDPRRRQKFQLVSKEVRTFCTEDASPWLHRCCIPGQHHSTHKVAVVLPRRCQ